MPRDETYEKPLPSAPDVEQAVIGALYLDNGLVEDAVTLFELDDFYDRRCRILLSIMIELHKEQIPFDPAVIGDRLRTRNAYEQAGGILFLSQTTHGLPHTTTLKPYAKILKEKSRLRWLIKEGAQITAAAFEEEDSQAVFTAAVERFSAMREKASTNGHGGSLREIVPALKDHLYLVRAGVNTAIPTGLRDLDRLTAGGIRPGELWGIAARSSRGKSSFLVQILLHMAKQGHPVVLFSLETQALSIAMRILAAETGVSMNSLRAPGHLREAEIDELIRVADEKFDLPLWIFTKGYKPVSQIKSQIRSLNRKLGADGKKLEAVGIDWYGKLSGYGGGRDRYENKTQELKYVADYLQQEIAIEEEVALIVPAQFNRSGWSAQDPGPANIDGGEAYHDACDLFAVLHNEPAKTAGEETTKARLTVYKQRNGPVAVGKEALPLVFHRTKMQFFQRAEDMGEEVPPQGDWQTPSDTPPVSPAGLHFDERERKDFL